MAACYSPSSDSPLGFELPFDLETGDVQRYQSDAADPRSLGHDFVLSLSRDRTGLLWAGTGGGITNSAAIAATRLGVAAGDSWLYWSMSPRW